MKTASVRIGLVSAFVFLAFLTSCAMQTQPEPTKAQATVDFDLLLNLPDEPIVYEQAVKPVLERRCVVCHGCYDAPCQLKLSSPEGILRGGNKDKVYDGGRILAAEPTRLFIDAKSTEEWRQKAFHPVLNESGGDAEQNLSQSVLYRMLRLKQRNPQPRVGMISENIDLGLDRAQTCPSPQQFDQYAEENPQGGMPFAMPNLADSEYRTLVQWLAHGAEMPGAPGPSAVAAKQIDGWEVFLNGTSNKQRLVARYLYEHLFVAHIHFEGTDEREFYRLVRSRSAGGFPVDEIAGVRPFDDPGSERFYYRFRRYHPGIVAKDHVVYRLSDARMDRYRELFLTPAYAVPELPSYEPDIAANPIKVFSAIPTRSRYKFLLDDARFFIEGFIKGPVCRGQVALNVIEDQFWVLFMDPERKLISLNDDFLDSMADYLQLPAHRGDTLNLLAIWTDYAKRQRKYMQARENHFERIDTYELDEALDFIWDGDGNPNAALTVFRHFDSASVSFGLLGDYPETAWVIDYPLFERIHYLLVAGFDVYGNVGHQLNTRLYMDFLRMEGENHFLAFLPASHRKTIRDSWYVGMREEKQEHFQFPTDWLKVESVSGYQTDDPQHELYQRLEQRLGGVARLPEDLDRCGDNCGEKAPTRAEQRADRALHKIADMDGEHLRVFPDVTFVRVMTEEEGGDLSYTLIRNKAYKHVTSMLADAERREAEDRAADTLTVLNWLEGAYPNFFLAVDLKDIDHFTDTYAAIRDRDDYERFVAQYGIRRTNPSFWEHADWFHDKYRQEQPMLSGLFDLNRYRNR